MTRTVAGWTATIRPQLERYDFPIPAEVTDAVDLAEKIKAQRDALALGGGERAALVATVAAGRTPTEKAWATWAQADKRRAVYDEATTVAEQRAVNLIAGLRDDIHQHLRPRFDAAVEHLRGVAATIPRHATVEGLLNSGQTDQARALAECAEHVQVIADARRLRATFTGGRTASAVHFWRDEVDPDEPRPSKPSVDEWLQGLRDGWQPWYPTPEEAQAELDRRAAEEAQRRAATGRTIDRLTFPALRG